jgi:adenosine deaminase
MSPEELLARMPKTEVHLHLEGTVGPDTLWALGQEYGVALPADSLEALRAMYAFESFDTFLLLWLAMHACFKDASAYERIVDAFLADCRRQNVRYVEAHFTPYNHDRLASLSGEEALAIVSRRLREAEAAGGPVVRLILDIPSEALPESGEYTASLLERIADPVVVAIGMGGPEVGFPRSAAAPYFARARRAGYPAVAHAGETHVAEHVLQAVHELKVQRVQHGVQAVEDPRVLALLAERQICCDVTPVSNTFLTPYRDLAAHPIRRMIDAGVPVTLGTDDPAFFGVDLTTEYVRAHREIGLSLAELWHLNLNGLRYGLADVALRRRLLQEFEAAGRALGIAGA